MITLRPYQQQAENEVFDAWGAGHRNVMLVKPTGAGKTAVMSSVFKRVNAASTAIAHRQELVSQISLALAKNDIYHRIIAADPVIRFCITRHIEEVGKNYHYESAPVTTAGVQTLIRRKESLLQWASQQQMWATDEAHHVCSKNSWGKAVTMFPRAFGLGVTASPLRADRKPLGRINGGLFDFMVKGPTMRWLINHGFLADYRIFAPTVSIDRSKIPVSDSTGELNEHEVRKAAHRSTITGDLVEHYMKIAPGKRGITFTVDVDQAIETAERYRHFGVPADAVSAKTPDKIRQNSIRRFEQGEIKQLVNVDLFGEGFDVPAVEVVSMGRPTESFGLYLQQFGRALRPLDGKTHGILLDHVGNVMRHGLPDADRQWSLEQDLRGAPKSSRDPDVIPVRRCSECFSAYEAITLTCPYCGHREEPESRSQPEFVNGDLQEFSPELLAQLRGEIQRVETGSPVIPHGANPATVGYLNKRWGIRQETLQELRDTINLWAGIETQVNDRTDSQAYSVFYHRYGIDVATAQTLETAKMVELTERIRSEWI